MAKRLEDRELLNLLLQKGYRFLSLRNRTEKEIRDYLNKKIQRYIPPLAEQNPKKIIEKLILQLKNEGLINDKKFIDWWVEQRNYFKPKGMLVLKGELRLKGVAKEMIDQYFEDHKFNEYELAKEALIKRQKWITSLKKEEQQKKAISLLLRRGFPYDISKKAFAEFLKNQ